MPSLPAPSTGDLFFDIEGDPYAFDDGLDYLFGVLETDGTFHSFWSRDASHEFRQTANAPPSSDWSISLMARLAADPTMHVYHYAPYEPTALKRLMGRYDARGGGGPAASARACWSTSRGAVRQSLGAMSVESYSIKKMEAFYGFEREIDLRDGVPASSRSRPGSELGEGAHRRTSSIGSSATTATTWSRTSCSVTGWRNAAMS